MTTQEAEHIQSIINNANLPPQVRSRLMTMLGRVDNLIKGGNYSEYELIRHYVEWTTKIPFGTLSRDNLNLEEVKGSLDSKHYGLEDVKAKILEYLAVLSLKAKNAHSQSSVRVPILLFLGIQGIGKTTMAKSIAEALGREFVRISVGGMTNVHEIRGKSSNLDDASPGQIVKALISTGTMNPVLLLDELDKVSTSGGADRDVMAALLEILDPEQNESFVDRYLDFPLDISKCMFILTANNVGGISTALLDRIEIVRFTSYNDEDKENIARNYLLPKVRKETGLSEEQLVFRDDVWSVIIRPLGFDAGIRELERTLRNIARKVAKQIVDGSVEGAVVLTPDNFRQYIPDDFGVYA
ncbi:AAA family ATPase [Candidatus Dojkabacteria bacterium]|uniref:AAA family ATPase n=1 Tax=Candidatus Dojkabacteria bacterium TaxID=2099670 RepID=A0A955L831_9BACT|nr:AAA family ATPase [Candidatus Dojkabacteria bacterium]